MPCRPSPQSLRQNCLIAVAKHLELLCYGAPKGSPDLFQIIESEVYIDHDTPFRDWPASLLVDLIKTVYFQRAGLKHLLYPVIQPQLTSFTVAIHGSIYVAMDLLIKRCSYLKFLEMTYSVNLSSFYYINFFRHFPLLTRLNVCGTLIDDAAFEVISQCCPKLMDLNASKTCITNAGFATFSELNDELNDGFTIRCPHLQVMNVESTRVSKHALGAFIKQHRKLCKRLEHPETFHGFNEREPKDDHVLTKLKSTCESLSPERYEYALDVCPKVDNITITSSGLTNENLYRLMTCRHLTRLHLGNLMSVSFSFYEGVVPVLQEIGSNLENLILEKFGEVDVTVIGLNCPNLKHLALSKITSYAPVINQSEDYFSQLEDLELWSTQRMLPICSSVLKQLLVNAFNIKKVLFRAVSCVDDTLLQEIWARNPMRALESVVFDTIDAVSKLTLSNLMSIPNQLIILRCWSCRQITATVKDEMKALIADNNFTLYFEWYPEPPDEDSEDEDEQSGSSDDESE